MIVVMSGLPARSQLFNGTVCADRGAVLRESLGKAAGMHQADSVGISSGSSSSGRKNSNSRHHQRQQQYAAARSDIMNSNPDISHTAPLVLYKLDPDTMTESKERDVINAIHAGVVTSFSGSGKYNWQLRNTPQWSNSNSGNSSIVSSGLGGAVIAFDADALRADSLGTHNSVYSQILVVGDNAMHLLSREGLSLATAEIPRLPIAAPVIGDFDNDGVSDIIIVTEGAVLGYHVHVIQSSRTITIAIVILAMIAVLVFVTQIQSVPLEAVLEAAAGTNTSGPLGTTQRSSSSRRNTPVPRSKASHIFQIIRSTDDQHID